MNKLNRDKIAENKEAKRIGITILESTFVLATIFVIMATYVGTNTTCVIMNESNEVKDVKIDLGAR